MELGVEPKTVGESHPVFIVAEMSANYFQKFDDTVDFTRAAKKAGADVAELKTYTPNMITIDCDKEYFQIRQQIARN